MPGVTAGDVALILQVTPRPSLSVVNYIATDAKPISGFRDGRVEPPSATSQPRR